MSRAGEVSGSVAAKSPKLMLATPYYAPKVGGLENYAHRIAQELIKRGWDVCAVTSNHESNMLQVDNVDGVRVYRMRSAFKLSNTPVGFDWAKQIREIIKKEQPNIIVAHTPVPGVADAAARAAGKIPFVLTYHAATLYKQNNLIFNAIILGYRTLEKLTLNKTAKAGQDKEEADQRQGQRPDLPVQLSEHHTNHQQQTECNRQHH